MSKISLIQAKYEVQIMENVPLQNNKCPDFECVDDSSCNFNGVCNNKECDCNNGFTGIDCAFDLKGDKLIFDMELNTPVHQLIQTKMIYFRRKSLNNFSA